MDIERDGSGRFLPGNSGGPGRPKRATETAYLRVLSDVLTPDAWRGIVERAVKDAQAGDDKARAWLSRFALGAEPPPLSTLAALDWLGIDDGLLEEAAGCSLLNSASGFPRPSAIDAAVILQTERAQLAETAGRRAERKAKKAALRAE